MNTQEIAKSTERDSRLESMRSAQVVTPRANVYETANELVLTVDMPGVDEKHVDVNVERNVLTLSGDTSWAAPKNHRMLFDEFGTCTYRRSFVIGAAVDASAIAASVKNGVLTVVLPKADSHKSRKIPVQGL